MPALSTKSAFRNCKFALHSVLAGGVTRPPASDKHGSRSRVYPGPDQNVYATPDPRTTSAPSRFSDELAPSRIFPSSLKMSSRVSSTRGENGRLELGGFASTLAPGPDLNSPPACGEFQRNAPEISTSTGGRGRLEIDLGSLVLWTNSSLPSMRPISHFAVASTVLCLIFLFLLMVGTGTGEEVAPFAGTDSTESISLCPYGSWRPHSNFYGLWAAWSQFQFSSDGKGLTFNHQDAPMALGGPILISMDYGRPGAWSQFQFSSDGKGLTFNHQDNDPRCRVLGFAAVAQIFTAQIWELH
ncbi:hypothetical protein C8R47DRAFT_1243480 [Mycena vitilis]|nr:hypothetical protein C8R47DRAFT_1243480 [Mycena vitilis]